METLSTIKNASTKSYGALITRNPETAANWLLAEKPVVVDWPDMEIIMSLTTPNALEAMARAKGRQENSPFVRITSRQYIDKLMHTDGIHPTITEQTRRIAAGIFELGTKEHPFGMLFPYDESLTLHKRLHGFLEVAEEKVPTVGFMISGPSESFEKIIDLLPEAHKVLAGTSANFSGDPHASGSGHHRVVGAVIDLGANPDICIFIPNETPREGRLKRKGPSTSTMFLTNNKAFHVREGSVGKDTIVSLFQSAGITDIDTVSQGYRKVLPYQYGKHYRHNLLFHFLLERYLYNKSKRGDFRIPHTLKQIFLQAIPQKD